VKDWARCVTRRALLAFVGAPQIRLGSAASAVQEWTKGRRAWIDPW
jgi:hypothetical protein